MSRDFYSNGSKREDWKEKQNERNRMKSKSQETKDVLRKNIKKIRTEKEMSQDLLGLMVGVSKQNVSNWELGKKIVSVERLRELAKAFMPSLGWRQK